MNQSPNSKKLLNNENKELKINLFKKEDVLQKFILQKKNVLLIVVGQIKFSEQKLLTKIKIQSLEKDYLLFII